jgi:hypothetical protein
VRLDFEDPLGSEAVGESDAAFNGSYLILNAWNRGVRRRPEAPLVCRRFSPTRVARLIETSRAADALLQPARPWSALGRLRSNSTAPTRLTVSLSA